MHTVFKFDIAIFTNTSKYNLAEGQNLNKLNKDIWYVAHTHTRFTIPDKNVYFNL